MARRQKWERKPKGIPAVTGVMTGERAQIIRYYMTRDEIGRFARQFAKCAPSVWSDIENDNRDISRSIEIRLLTTIPGLDWPYLRRGDRKGLGEGLAAVVAQAHMSAQPPPPPPLKTGTKRTKRAD